MSRKPVTLAERFWPKVIRQEGEFFPGACWEWSGFKDDKGYGRLRDKEGGRWVNPGAYRASMKVWFGGIPDGLEVDHVCRNPGCVNPMHLEAVTCAENIRRGAACAGVLYERKTHCKRGHRYPRADSWFCPECHKLRALLYRRRLGVLPRGPKTHCPKGHAYTKGNIYIIPNSGAKTCLECQRERSRQRTERRRLSPKQ